MEGIIKQKPVFDIKNLSGDRFYKLTYETGGLNNSVYRCILIEKSEQELTFMYAWDLQKDEIKTSKLKIRISDLSFYKIEVIK